MKIPLLTLFIILNYIARTNASKLEIPPNGLGANKVQINVTTLLEWPETESFISDYAKPSTPFIVQGAALKWPAFHTWTNEHFLSIKEGMGEHVTVEQAKKEDREIPALEKSFHDFVSSYEQEDWYMVERVPTFLRKDVIMPPMFQCPLLADLLLEQMMWFSSGGTKSVLHFDSMENIHCLIAGRKLFVLIDPSSEVAIDQPQGRYSSVDVDNVDYIKYPDLAAMDYHLAYLAAGDCLYLPYHWYHQVRSLDRNIGVNIWWDHHTMMSLDFTDCPHEYNPKTMEECQFHGTAKLLQNQQIVKSHFLMLASQGGTPLTFDRLLFMFLGDEKQRPEKDQTLENLFKSIFTTFDQNKDDKIVPDEVETLPQQGWIRIQQSLQEIQQYFEDNTEDFAPEDEDAVNHDWDDNQKDAQYDAYDEAVLDDMDYMDFHERDEL